MDVARGVACIKCGADEWRLKSNGESSTCPETNPAFLTIDHIHGDGAAQRRAMGFKDPRSFRAYLKREGWPKDRYQLLCWNCICGRAQNGGICPHEMVGQSAQTTVVHVESQ